MTTSRTYTTAEVARQLGISKRSLYRWLEEKWIREPRMVKAGKSSLRIWTDRDIKRALKFKTQHQREYGQLRAVLDALSEASASKSVQTAGWSQLGKQLESTGSRSKPLGPVGKYRAMGPTDEILTRDELAARLKVKPSWVFEQTRKRTGIRNPDPFPFFKVGRYLRFSWQDVVAWTNRQAETRREAQQKGTDH